MRSVLGLIAGAVAAVAAMMLVGFIGGMFVPLSDAVVPGQREALTVALASASIGAQAIVLLAWAVAGFAGAATARWVSRAAWPGWAIAGLLAVMLAGAFLVPLPIWMQVLAVLGPLAGGMLAHALVPGNRLASDAVATVNA